MEKNSRIYIAGHRGMVGSAIQRNLQKNGYSNLILRTSQQLNLIRQHDVEEFFRNENPEYVIIAAAKVGGIEANNAMRAQFIYENLMIQSNIIHSSYLNKVKKLIFLGSSCIYPKFAKQPINEEYLLSDYLEDTNEPYAIAKIAGIKLCESYYRQHGCNFFSIMPSNLYGPNDNFNLKESHVLSALMRKMHLGKCLMNNDWDAIVKDLNTRPIDGVDGSVGKETILDILSENGIRYNKDFAIVTIWGTGNPLREFLHVDDLAEAINYLLKKFDLQAPEPTSDKRFITFFNVGSGSDLTIAELAEKIKIITGFEGRFEYDISKHDGTPRKLMDVSKIKKQGWKQNISLDDGIKSMYVWYKQYNRL